jgi:hypothetical protein
MTPSLLGQIPATEGVGGAGAVLGFQPDIIGLILRCLRPPIDSTAADQGRGPGASFANWSVRSVRAGRYGASHFQPANLSPVWRRWL